MNDYVDGYCERLEPGFWGEPFNAVSNLAFLAAAVTVWMLARRAPWHVRVLAVLVGLVFLGSAAFHTTATGWGAAVDTGFIAVFLLYYIVLFTHLFLAVPWRWAWLAAPAFVVFTVLVSAVSGFAGPGMYISALLTLVGIGGYLAATRQPEWWWFVAAAVVFAASLTLRTLDEPLCGTLPVGTHFLWHVLNAVTLLLVSHAAVRRAAIRTDQPVP